MTCEPCWPRCPHPGRHPPHRGVPLIRTAPNLTCRSSLRPGKTRKRIKALSRIRYHSHNLPGNQDRRRLLLRHRTRLCAVLAARRSYPGQLPSAHAAGSRSTDQLPAISRERAAHRSRDKAAPVGPTELSTPRQSRGMLQPNRPCSITRLKRQLCGANLTQDQQVQALTDPFYKRFHPPYSRHPR